MLYEVQIGNLDSYINPKFIESANMNPNFYMGQRRPIFNPAVTPVPKMLSMIIHFMFKQGLPEGWGK